jgi:hypothetical protein
MLDSKLAEKLLRLGLCPGAHQGEWESAAIKFFASLRKEGVKAEEFLGVTNGSQPFPQHHEQKTRPREMVMPFGKHKGEAIREIAQWHPDYLNWILDNIENLNKRLRDEIIDQLERFGH